MTATQTTAAFDPVIESGPLSPWTSAEKGLLAELARVTAAAMSRREASVRAAAALRAQREEIEAAALALQAERDRAKAAEAERQAQRDALAEAVAAARQMAEEADADCDEPLLGVPAASQEPVPIFDETPPAPAPHGPLLERELPGFGADPNKEETQRIAKVLEEVREMRGETVTVAANGPIADARSTVKELADDSAKAPAAPEDEPRDRPAEGPEQRELRRLVLLQEERAALSREESRDPPAEEESEQEPPAEKPKPPNPRRRRPR